jgi:hypothetical protein
MASIPVMINGVIWDHAMKAGRAATFLGEMSYTDLSVGGGPIFPPPGGGPPGAPIHPIWGPPGIDFPDRPGYPPVAGHPLPPIPPDPPSNPGEPKPPPPGGGWGWHPEYGWGYFPMGGGKPQPPGAAGAAKK